MRLVRLPAAMLIGDDRSCLMDRRGWVMTRLTHAEASGGLAMRALCERCGNELPVEPRQRVIIKPSKGPAKEVCAACLKTGRPRPAEVDLRVGPGFAFADEDA